MGYEYDVFLSYPRQGYSGDWVRNHFHDALVGFLDQEMAEEPRVYFDQEQAIGVNWPANVRRALLRSKILVAVWCPPYFRSDWCMAEWASMRAREQKLGLATTERPQGLVVPVVSADGKTFPNEARGTQWRDMSQWNFPTAEFGRTAEYVEFHREMRTFAGELSGLIAAVPDWADDWPVDTPPPENPPAFGLPRL
jgi:hypothetical protein